MTKVKLIIFIFITTFALSACNQKPENTYQITETYKIESATDKITYLSVDLPITYGYQSIGDIEVQNVEEYSYEQKGDYQTLNTHIKGNGDEITVVVKYEITLAKGNISWHETVDNQYLNPSELIDSEDQKIIETAKSLIVKDDNLKTAKNISKFVSDNIQFDTTEKINQRSLKASEVLDNKQGVCYDYANLLTALLRAADIPTKSTGGLSVKNLSQSSDWSSQAGSHAWVEFYIDGQWYFDDPSWGNKYFMNSDGYHISYGTSIININSQEYKDHIQKYDNEDFYIIGAMTAPIKFTAWSEDENAAIIPRVDIIKK